jgi:hypothetical protein
MLPLTRQEPPSLKRRGGVGVVPISCREMRPSTTTTTHESRHRRHLWSAGLLGPRPSGGVSSCVAPVALVGLDPVDPAGDRSRSESDQRRHGPSVSAAGGGFSLADRAMLGELTQARVASSAPPSTEVISRARAATGKMPSDTGISDTRRGAAAAPLPSAHGLRGPPLRPRRAPAPWSAARSSTVAETIGAEHGRGAPGLHLA